MTISEIPAPLSVPSPLGPPPSPRSLAEFQPPSEEGGLDWRRVLSALLRFRWPIVGVTLLGTAAGVMAARVLGANYVAQATIWIDVARPYEVERGPAPIRSGQLLDTEAWVELLRSYVVLDWVVRDQRLFVTPKSPADTAALAAFRVADQYRPGQYRMSLDPDGQTYTLSAVENGGSVLEHGAVGDSVGRKLGFAWAPAPGTLPADRNTEFHLATLRDAALQLGDSLHAQLNLEGSFLRLELRGPDPTQITAIVNAVAERYVTVAADLKRQKLTELTKILSEQLQAAQENLRSAEAALERFRVRTITLPTDRPPPPSLSAPGGAGGGVTDMSAQGQAFGGFFGIQLEREQARRDRDALQRFLAQGSDAGLSPEALGLLGSVQRSSELSQALQELTVKQAQLRALRYRYSDEYPTVQRLLGEISTLERQTIPNLVRGLVGRLAAREAELGRRLEADSRDLRQIPARAIEEARLRRAVGLAETLYTTLQQRYEEARLADASTIPDVRILDSAVVPRQPMGSGAMRLIFVAFVGSFGLAAMGAVLLDRMDPRVRYPEQVSREMGLPILGAVPHLRPRARRGGNGGARLPDEDIAEVVEAMRGVCLSLVYAHGPATPMLVTISSPGAGDGKSFLAANLGHTFAEAGHRTLLIDGDIRRGVLHRRLGARRRPGLSDYLRGEVPLDAIVQATAYPSFSVVGCGTRAYNAPELLGSEAMSQLVSAVRSSFDVILVDSPPLGAGVDSLILGTLTGSLVVVLRTGYSHREVAAAKLEMLQRLPIRLLGAILNDVPAGAGYRYYSYYLPGYEAVDEDAGPRPRVI